MILKILVEWEKGHHYIWLDGEEIYHITKEYKEGSTCEYNFYGKSPNIGDLIRWITVVTSSGEHKHIMLSATRDVIAYILNENGKTIDKIN